MSNRAASDIVTKYLLWAISQWGVEVGVGVLLANVRAIDDLADSERIIGSDGITYRAYGIHRAYGMDVTDDE